LAASLVGDELENRRNQLRATLPIRRIVGPADVAALALHITDLVTDLCCRIDWRRHGKSDI
jgi:hypothetical protein